MPRFLIYIGTHEASIETERPITHALIGQLDIMAHQPPQELMEKARALKRVRDSASTPEQRLTPDEQRTLQQFTRDNLHGKFDLKALDWFEDAEMAEKAKLLWPERINMQVIPIQAKLP